VRASRLVSLLLLLQTRGGLTARELAAELEVSERTVYRDVDALAEAGIPIYAERGPHGGVRLVEGYRTRLTGLTTDEAEALFLSGMPGPAAALGLGTVVAAARLKVLAALPPELRARASRIAERFHLDAPGWFQSTEELPHLDALATGVWEARVVEIEYRRGERVVSRRLQPLGLVLKGGIWYLVARSSGQLRTYRVSRVVAAAVTPEVFERPADFDLARFWSASIAAYERDLPRVEVVFRVAATALETVADVVGDRRIRVGRSEADGTVSARVRFEWYDEAITAAFRLAAEAEVIEPESVRASVVTTARAALARYETVPAGRAE